MLAPTPDPVWALADGVEANVEANVEKYVMYNVIGLVRLSPPVRSAVGASQVLRVSEYRSRYPPHGRGWMACRERTVDQHM